MHLVAVVVVALSSGASSPESYLINAKRAVELCRADLPDMAPVADAAAARLIAGGPCALRGSRRW